MICGHNFQISRFFSGPFVKSLLSLLQYCFCFMFWFLGHEVCGNLTPWPGIKPTPLALEGEALTTGLPVKSLYHILLMAKFNFFFLSRKSVFIWRACSKQNAIRTSHTAGPQGEAHEPVQTGTALTSVLERTERAWKLKRKALGLNGPQLHFNLSDQ